MGLDASLPRGNDQVLVRKARALAAVEMALRILFCLAQGMNPIRVSQGHGVVAWGPCPFCLLLQDAPQGLPDASVFSNF